MTHTVHLGDCLDVLPTLAAGSVHCCVTSPPYWALRKYEADDRQHGSEPTMEAFIQTQVRVFAEVRRVLRDDGVLWLNMGDKYGEGKARMLIPFRLALALQADGWICRDVVVWHKPAPMPESAGDRCTQAWEPVFMFVKQPEYYSDFVAVQEESIFQPGEREDVPRGGFNGKNDQEISPTAGSFRAIRNTKNLRNVWRMAAEPYTDPGGVQHFAAYPTELPRKCILASTSEKGCCDKCGAAYARIIDKQKLRRERPNELTKRTGDEGTGNHCANTVAGVRLATIRWEPTCKCGGGVVPCTVLDPYTGSGTTGAVAAELGRDFVGVELSDKYHAMAVDRIGRAANPATYRSERVYQETGGLFA
jgi:DNA modification methylase